MKRKVQRGFLHLYLLVCSVLGNETFRDAVSFVKIEAKKATI